jgi:hypothetical protein
VHVPHEPGVAAEVSQACVAGQSMALLQPEMQLLAALQISPWFIWPPLHWESALQTQLPEVQG